MIVAEGSPQGILANIRQGVPQFPGDVELAAMPAGPIGTVWQVDLTQPPPYTAFEALSGVQAATVAALLAQADAFVDQSYNPNTLQLLNGLYSQAVLKGLANRAAYLDPIIEWGNAVAAALEAAIGQVEAATTAEQVAAVTLSLPAPPSPLPTRAGAMQIAN